ncbi:MAG: DUF4238 domain-containing protein [Gemmatimonadota bacterium]|nr:DUF4238 domain-containing protein [Gemmatimonadota bacterium]
MDNDDRVSAGKLNLPKLHHYVPQFLLRGFAFRRKREAYVYAYDKQTDRVFPTNVRNAAAETGFNNARIGGAVVSAEGVMGALEDDVAPLVQRIVREESLAWLSEEERAKLSLFTAVQLTRTRNYRDMLGQAQNRLAEALRRRGIDPEALEGYEEPTEDMLAAQQLRAAFSAHEVAPLIHDKTWVLLRNSTPRPYFTSDNPVAFQNTKHKRPGALGLGAAGIEIYLPLSSRFTLSMVCTGYEEQLRDIAATSELLRLLGALPPELEENSRRVDAMLSAIRDGTPLEQTAENVTNQNSLQVLSATRYVYSDTDDFDLVRHMLEEEPDLRSGGPEVVVDELA